jgi:hypothetical protein
VPICDVEIVRRRPFHKAREFNGLLPRLESLTWFCQRFHPFQDKSAVLMNSPEPQRFGEGIDFRETGSDRRQQMHLA